MIYSVRLASHDMCEERVYTASIEECQRRVLEYVNKYNVAASNWIGGEVFDGLGNLIGRIACNGNFSVLEDRI